MSAKAFRGATGRGSWRPHGSLAILGLAAVLLELVGLALWPTLYLADSPAGRSAFGDMLQRRFPIVADMREGLKGVVDWLFPGALWSGEYVVTFFVLCILAAFLAYGAAAWALAKREDTGDRFWAAGGLAWVVVPQLLLQATLLFTPASLTTDIYSYALYGEMPAVYGANPFTHTPAEFPQSASYYLIPTYWHDAPSAYGPLWIALSAGVATVFHFQPLIDELLVYRLIGNLAHVVNTFLVWTIARQLGSRPPTAAALAYGWNPLLLMEFALNGHNDALMLTFLLLAVRLALVGRTYLCAFALGLSVATKYTTVLVAPMAIAWSAGMTAGTAALGSTLVSAPFVRRLVGGCAIVAATLLVLYLPWIEGTRTFDAVLYWVTGPRLHNFWPEPLLVSLTAWIAGPLRVPHEVVWEPLLNGFKALAKLGLAGLIVWELLHVSSGRALLIAGARIWLFFLLLVNTWIMPWYYAWPLTFAAALGWRSALVRVCAGLTLTAGILMYQRQLGYSAVGEWGGLTLVLPIVIALLPKVGGAASYIAALPNLLAGQARGIAERTKAGIARD